MMRWLRGAARPAEERDAGGPRRGRRFAVRPQNSRYAFLDETNATLSSLFVLPAAPVLVRLIFFNDTDAGWPLDGAAMALTSVVGDGLEPRETAGAPDNRLWRQATFAHEGADREPVEMPGANDRFGLILRPNPRESGRTELIFSDWTTIDGPSRADGRGALLLVRAYSRERLRYSGSVGPPQPAVGLPSYGHVIQGNAATPPFAGIARRDDRLFACYGVECLSAMEVATVVAIGDSILHGSCSTGELSGPVARACVLASTSERPIAFFNEAYPGRNSLAYHFNGARLIETLRPRVAVIQTWSQNEEWSRVASDGAFARALALADFALRRGCVPILTTPAPVFAGQPEFDAHRVRNVSRVREAGQNGLPILDLDRIWGDGGDPNAYQAAFNCGDGMHANDAGCEAAAKALAILVREAIARDAWEGR